METEKCKELRLQSNRRNDLKKLSSFVGFTRHNRHWF